MGLVNQFSDEFLNACTTHDRETEDYIVHEVIEHRCIKCGSPLGDHEGHSYYKSDDGKFYCLDCALKNGWINAEEWAGHALPGGIPYHHAAYKDGVVTIFYKWGRGYRKYTINI